MTYINSRGQLVEQKPITTKIYEFFYGFISIFVLFFRTLIEPLIGKDSRAVDQYRANNNRGFYGGGGSGGGGPGARKGKRIGGFGDFSSGGPNSPPCATSS